VPIRSTALVVGVVTLTTGCLTGLGLPPPMGGGGQSGTTQKSGPTATGDRGGGASDGGSPLLDGGPGTGGSTLDALPARNNFDLERWVTKQGPLIAGTKWLAGDFDDDGRTDLAAVFNDQGNASIDVWLSTGSTFVRQRWATQQGAFWDAQKWLAGDFDGDGRADLANVFNDLDQISIDVHRSTRNGFTVERWATRQGDFWDAQQWVAGDFDGDRDTDLANVFEEFGKTSFDLHRSTGSAFTFQRWATRTAAFSATQKWLAGTFGDDGADALLTVFDDNGGISLDAYFRSGTTLIGSPRGRQLGPFSVAQKWLAGNFAGGGGAPDLANVFGDQDQASIDVLLVNASGTAVQRWATQQGAYWDAQQWLAGDFDRDQMDDLANVFGDNGFISIDVHHRLKP